MKVFETTDHIPDSFEGKCYVKHPDSIRWYKNGRLHREDGPALIDVGETEYWFTNGILHRLDVPAVVYKTGNYQYWINYCVLSAHDFWNHPRVLIHKLNKILQEL